MAQTRARIFVHVVFSTKDRAPLPREPIRSADLSYAPSGLICAKILRWQNFINENTRNRPFTIRHAFSQSLRV